MKSKPVVREDFLKFREKLRQDLVKRTGCSIKGSGFPCKTCRGHLFRSQIKRGMDYGIIIKEVERLIFEIEYSVE